MLHHGIIGAIDPRAVYDHGDALREPWKWSLIHGAFILCASAVGIATWRMNEDARAEVVSSRRASEARFSRLVEQSSDLILLLDAAGQVCYVSPSAERLLGLRRGEAGEMANWCAALARQLDAPGNRRPLPQPAEDERLELRLRHVDGSLRYFDAIARNLLADPTVGAIVVNARDSTERKQFETRLLYEARVDSLTGLANKAHFLQQLGARLAATAHDDDRLAVLFLDLDGFKHVNDSLGHATGDALLQLVAERLRNTLARGDLAARFGGDEFCVLVDRAVSREVAAAAAERILAALRAPFTVEQRELYVGASIGIALALDGPRQAEDMLREADTALYQAKGRGKGCYAVFDSSMASEALARLELETDLQHALARDELRVHYQPEVDLQSGELIGCEALVRWQHPRRGLLTPGLFIPLAEENGLIEPIGRWVLAQACLDFREWRRRFPSARRLRLSVNLSGRQFRDPDLTSQIAAIVQRSGIDPGDLQLEITESVLMHDIDATVRVLADLRALGVRLAIDDFGTGYSSLAYLQRFPAHTVKIDRSFVQGLGRDSEADGIVEAIVAMARALQLDVTAEGIETATQHERLLDLDCRRGQGFAFSRPRPPAEFEQLLALHRPAPLAIEPAA